MSLRNTFRETQVQAGFFFCLRSETLSLCQCWIIVIFMHLLHTVYCGLRGITSTDACSHPARLFTAAKSVMWSALSFHTVMFLFTEIFWVSLTDLHPTENCPSTRSYFQLSLHLFLILLTSFYYYYVNSSLQKNQQNLSSSSYMKFSWFSVIVWDSRTFLSSPRKCFLISFNCFCIFLLS